MIWTKWATFHRTVMLKRPNKKSIRFHETVKYKHFKSAHVQTVQKTAKTHTVDLKFHMDRFNKVQ